MPLGIKVGLSLDGIVLDGDPAPPRKGAQHSPLFGPCLLPNGWMHHDSAWYGGRPRPRRHCVRWGRSPSHGKGHSSPHFSSHVYCGQTAECIRIALGTEVDLGQGDIVLDGTQLPRLKRAQQLPLFGPCLLWPNGHPCQHQLSCSMKGEARKSRQILYSGRTYQVLAFR